MYISTETSGTDLLKISREVPDDGVSNPTLLFLGKIDVSREHSTNIHASIYAHDVCVFV